MPLPTAKKIAKMVYCDPYGWNSLPGRTMENMKLYSKQIQQGKPIFLLATDGDPKTRASKGLLVSVKLKTVERVRDLPAVLKQGFWKSITGSDPTLDALASLVPALRPYRGIEVRLTTGKTAWICWRQWSSEDANAQALLTQATSALVAPKYEPDGDYYLAVQAMSVLGGEVLDPPRSRIVVPDDTY